MKIIPAIDIINGKCVRLTQGDYTKQTVYHGSPVEVAKQFESYGVKHLHLVDLDGAKAGGVVNEKVLKAITTQTKLKVDFGGGIKTEEDLNKAFDHGACQVTVGSTAFSQPELFQQWLNTYGANRLILGADMLKGRIAISGWQKQTHTDGLKFIQNFVQKGVSHVIATDISKDGMLDGPAIEMYQQIICQNKGVNVIASGGVTTLADIQQLSNVGCHGAIIGKAIYENKISLKSLMQYVN